VGQPTTNAMTPVTTSATGSPIHGETPYFAPSTPLTYAPMP
jgi:hypothetical protein